MKNLKYQIQNITKPLIRKNGFVTPKIIFDWPLIVGDYLSEFTSPLKIVFPSQSNANGCLHIEVIGAQAPIIQQLEPEIIERIASYFGFKAVAKIKLIHSYEMPKDNKAKALKALSAMDLEELDKMVAEVEDDELKQKLKSIGEHIYRRRT